MGCDKPLLQRELKKAIAQISKAGTETIGISSEIGQYANVFGRIANDRAERRLDPPTNNPKNSDEIVATIAVTGYEHSFEYSSKQKGVPLFGVESRSMTPPENPYRKSDPEEKLMNGFAKTHAEGRALLDLYHQHDGDLSGKTIILYTDKDPCKSCQGMFTGFAEETGITNLEVHGPNFTGIWGYEAGKVTKEITRGEGWIPSGKEKNN